MYAKVDDVLKTTIIDTPWIEESIENNNDQQLDIPKPFTPIPILKRSSRPHKSNRKYLNYILLADEEEPKNYDEACQTSYGSKWELAKKGEMKSLISNQA